MSVASEHVNAAIAAAKQLEQQGYFAKAKTGDERGASYFARMVASRANPNGASHGWGWLKKTGGGFSVEGYADGAIVWGNDPSNRNNVLKIVTQVGSSDPNAIQIGSAVQERRESDIWASPVPLPDALPAYLVGGSPVPSPSPVLNFPPRDANLRVLGVLDKFYAEKGRPNRVGDGSDLHIDNEGIAVWLGEFQRRFVMGENEATAISHVLADLAAAWPK